MNRLCHRLVFRACVGALVPVAETARGHGRGRQCAVPSGVVLALALALAVVGSSVARAELPVPSPGDASRTFVSHGQANYQVQGAQAMVNQVGTKAILNWQSFNLSPGASVQFRQVDSLAASQPVAGAQFTTLNRIWDANPSVIAGRLEQAAGQKANVILVNGNGIAFMGGSQVNLNSFTASSLDIKDSLVLETLLPGDRIPQFQGEGGFVKVFEGARISAGNFGRVMLLAPTVVNKGTVSAPDGQVIAAAASKVYLRAAGTEDPNVRGLLVEIDSPAALNDAATANAGIRDGLLDGQAVGLTDRALDKLGQVSNLGQLGAARGNVSMIGYAVNQQGIASATTSVVSNGSVYLQAKDRAIGSAGSLDPAGAQRGGLLVLGAGSVTRVMPEVEDGTGAVDGSAGAGLDRRSQVQMLAQEIRMSGGAQILAPSGEVTMVALERPGSLNSTESIFHGNTAVSDVARIHIADGARIDVAGLERVQVSAARNTVAVELRGDELKDSPVNQVGPLRGETVYMDVNKALARADAGASTLVARESLAAYQARTERGVAERSISGGAVRLLSQGEAIVEAGATLDLSGGSLQYTPALVPTTTLSRAGAQVAVADASALERYDGIGTRYVIDYGRWNRTEVVDLGEALRYDPGYLEGKDAGSLDVFGMRAAFVQATLAGRTTVGVLQQASGTAPEGARLTLGFDDPTGRNAVSNLALPTRDYKLNQDVVLAAGATPLPAGFGFGSVLPDALAQVLTLDTGLLGQDKVARLQVWGNQAVAVQDPLLVPAGGAVSLLGSQVNVQSGIQAASGTISLAARNTVATVPVSLSGDLPDPNVVVADGVRLSVHGLWTNELPGVSIPVSGYRPVDGGSISLTAQTQADGTSLVARGSIALGTGSVLDADAGASLAADGTVIGGAGGSIALVGHGITGLAGGLSGYGLGSGAGGSLTLGSSHVGISGSPLAPASGLLQLDPSLFSQGGFSRFTLEAQDTLLLAADTRIAPRMATRMLDANHRLAASGTALEGFSHVAQANDRVRAPVDLRWSARQPELGTGTLVLGPGSHVDADTLAELTLLARERIELQGRITAPGGSIAATLDRSGGQASGPANVNPIWLGPQAVLDVSGLARTYVDGAGRTVGDVLGGGSIDLQARTGYVVTTPGSRIDVSGAKAVRLDVPNEAGGLGRMVGSDAGNVRLFADQGAVLDGDWAAHGGGSGNRGGSLSLTLGRYVEPVLGSPPQPDTVLGLAAAVAPLAGALTPLDAIPEADVVRMRVGTDVLEQAGFDRLGFASRDAIRLQDGLQLGAARALPLREVLLDAARIQTTGGDARIQAEQVRLGNLEPGRVPGRATGVPAPGAGSLTLQAQQLELAGTLQLDGMAQVQLTGNQGITLAGTSDGTQRPAGALIASADLRFTAGVVAPATYADYRIEADGHLVRFDTSGVSPLQPLTAVGALRVLAQDIVQAGALWAPFGQIDLQAADTLTLVAGSLTSVAASAGSLTPFGKVQNGRSWIYDLDAGNVPAGQIEQLRLPDKAIRLSGRQLDLQPQSRLDLSGGGDLQAHEFTVGPGGSRDVLTDPGMYAIVPGYRAGVAPVDLQDAGDAQPSTGSAVYLSGAAQIGGGAGLPDGVYTLLPAHYALLPGAFAVRVDTGVMDRMPGPATVRADGITIASGYLTDTRAQAPADARWRAIEVMTQAQVLARSEFSLNRASQFFAATTGRPQDAGLLSIRTSGAGSRALVLDATIATAAGAGGRGAAVDISAPDLAIVARPEHGLGPDATALSVDTVSGLGAASVLLGATRTRTAEGTSLQVESHTVTLANDARQPLRAAEVMLAATGSVTLASGSMIDAQGEPGDVGPYTTEGNGALLRAATTSAQFTRTGAPDRSTGSLRAASGSVVRAAAAIVLDASRDNTFGGTTEFIRGGAPVAGDLSLGATRIHLGDAPLLAEGVRFDQAALDGLDRLARLSLTSYSTIDLHGDVVLGGIDAATGQPTLQALRLNTAGLAGIGNAGLTATVRAQSMVLSNPAAVAFIAGGPTGSGRLDLQAGTLTLGEGHKELRGFEQVAINAAELVGQGVGSTTLAGASTIASARVSAQAGARQVLSGLDALQFTRAGAQPAPAAEALALGGSWRIDAARLLFDTQAVLPSGELALTARAGDLQLGSEALVDVAGRLLPFFDAAQPSWGGQVRLTSQGGDVLLTEGARVDVSAAPGADAGALVVSASDGSVNLAPGSAIGHAGVDADGTRGEGARVAIDAASLAGFSALNAALNQGGFGGERALRARSGDIAVAPSDRMAAARLRLAADEGRITVAGTLDASGVQGGSIALFAGTGLQLASGARVDAHASGATQDGGEIMLGTRGGTLALSGGSVLALGGGAGGRGGAVVLRAPRTGAGAGTDVAVSELAGTVSGARTLAIEAVKLYDGKTTLTATGGSAGTSLSLTTLGSDNTAFASRNAAIAARLGQDANPAFHILSGVEVHSGANLTLSGDWNLVNSRAGGEPGVLTLRADGNLLLDANLSDGFSHATACTTATCSASSPSPATLRSGDSWSLRLVAGADAGAADPLAVIAGSSDLTLAAGKRVRTGTGSIEIASGRDIVLADNRSVIHTAGRPSDPVSGFVNPSAVLRPVFAQDGGDLHMQALGDIRGKPSAQLYSEWLYRQGALDPATDAYAQQTAWWVRFDQFAQGVGALGGGDVVLRAGGDVKDVSVSAPTQARQGGISPDASRLVRTGGGDVRVEAGARVLGGSYHADAGELRLRAGSDVGPSEQTIQFNVPALAPLLALGDTQARVQVGGDLTISHLLNPHLLVQSAGNLAVGIGVPTPRRSLFSTYAAGTGVALQSLTGDVTLQQGFGLAGSFSGLLNSAEGRRDNQLDQAYWLPPSLLATAWQGDVTVGSGNRAVTMSPAAVAQLRLLAADTVAVNTVLSMSDRDPTRVPDPVRPAALDTASAQGLLLIPTLLFNPESPQVVDHAASPVHTGDTAPALVYALHGDVRGSYDSQAPNLVGAIHLPKAARVRAGQDVRDFGVTVQHSDAADRSQIDAGRDLQFSGTVRRDNARLWVAGPGTLQVTAGRTIDLGTSAGIVSRGDLDNANLPPQGADLQLAAGVGAYGVDATGAVLRLRDRLAGGAVATQDLWLARWLAGDDAPDRSQALAAVQAVAALPAAVQQDRMRGMVFSALRATGRDANNAQSPFAGDFARGYAALELLFPGVGDKDADGNFRQYLGDIDLFASRVKTERGGSIELLLPGGQLTVGLSNTPAGLVDVGSNVLGLVVAGDGDIRGFARGDIRVNQSRVLTVGGGDVLLWSSEGDIDAGKGKKTASAVPPPLNVVDAQGNVTQVLQGAVTGSGIGALSTAGGTAGDVDLIAPRGTVDAGDAGIRAGNLNIAAQIVLGSDNIAVSGTSSGTPVADTSAITAAASGATTGGDDGSRATAALNQSLAESAQSAQTQAQAVRPSLVRVEVLGFGDR